MNSKILIFLAIILSAAILGPSVRSLLDLDATSVFVIDLNEEEESQETKKDNSQQEFLFGQQGRHLFQSCETNHIIFTWAFNEEDKASLDILLPPPRINV